MKTHSIQKASSLVAALGLALVSVHGADPKPDSDPVAAKDALALIHVPEGFEAELLLAEPDVIDPVAINWGADGRLWVAEMADYPMGMDGKGKPGGRVRWLKDSNGDGKYDKSVVFAEGLAFPNGILPWKKGVLVTAAPLILYLEDTDGDGVSDKREVLFEGFQEGNQQLRVNGLVRGLDNWIYCASGAHTSNYGADNTIKSIKTGKEYALGSRDFRFNPETGELDPQSGPSQFGRNR
ncbi:MAG: dehydrogenase, partial [Verrucomicrobia bacterium]|nr:dehydrogenase [Verrucomicrobiota bacterium]